MKYLKALRPLMLSCGLIAGAVTSGYHLSHESGRNGMVSRQEGGDASQMLVQGERFIDLSDAGNRALGDLAITSDGSKLVVVRDIRSPIDDRIFGLSLVDLATGSVQTTLLPEEGRPIGVVLHPDDSRAFVAVSKQSGSSATEGRNRVDVIDIRSATPAFERSIVLDASLSAFGPTGIALAPGGSPGYVADRGNFLLHVFETTPSADPVLATVNTGGTATGVAVTPDGGRVYVANRSPSTVTCIDTNLNAVGAGACQEKGTIGISVGPSGAKCDIIISPEGRTAYAICNLGAPCISVIDTDPFSASFNQEVRVIPTSGDRLEQLAISEDGERLYVVSRLRKEVLVFDTAMEKQVQRVVFDPGGDLVGIALRNSNAAVNHGDTGFLGLAYVSDRAGRKLHLLKPGRGVFLPPDGDSNKTAGYSDTRSENSACEDPYTAGEPDLGVDELFVARTSPGEPNCRQFTIFGAVWEVCVAPDNPLNFTIYPPPESETQQAGLKAWVGRQLRTLLQTSAVDRYEVTVEELTAGLRPFSARINAVASDGSTSESIVSALDADDDGVIEAVKYKGPIFVPELTWDLQYFDTDGDGMQDYVGWPLNLSGQKLFLPLSDSNGDGEPDSTSWDFDRDGKADPDLPPFPFLTGPSNPETNFVLHFAQFGDGGPPESNLFSQIRLFNLDPGNAAEITVWLRDDSGDPLTVDLDGVMVTGTKELNIPAGGVQTLETDGAGELRVGSVTVESNRAVAGVILFGGTQGVAGVGVSRVMPAGFVSVVQNDEVEGTNTGIAVKNIEDSDQNISLLLKDSEGTLLATSALELAPLGHRALFVSEIDWQVEDDQVFSLADFQGILEVVGSGDLAGTVIQNSPGEFATLPVMRRYPQATVSTGGEPRDRGLDQSLYFAQFGDGQSGAVKIKSQILLFNLTRLEADARVFLRDSEGNLIALNLNGDPINGETDVVIPEGGLKVLSTDGLGPLQVGSATVHSDRALAGVIVFSGTTGIAGVGSSQRFPRGFKAAVQREIAGINTGIAIMDLSGAANDLRLRLFDKMAALLATAQLSLSAGGQRALFLDEIDWTEEPGVVLDLGGFEGLIEVRGEGPTAATIIQTRPGVFATQPVVSVLK